jgi:hypothetical protein
MSLVDEARSVRERIAARLRELEPLVREYEELRELAAEMGMSDAGQHPTPGESERRESVRPPEVDSARPSERGASRRQPQARRATQRNGEGELSERVVSAVRDNPGRTVAEYAAILGVAPTALYRPVRSLASDGVLTKRARQLFPG